MTHPQKYIIGTSGYSFPDWVGTFYPPDVRRQDMLEYYMRVFRTVELNFTYYRMPTHSTLEKMARVTGDEFTFWVKANQETTHKQNRSVAQPYLDALTPLIETAKLAGVLLQFPQSFHRTVASRKYLAAALDDLDRVPLAVEFRHHSWAHPASIDGLRDRDATLVVPDVPDLAGLFRIAPTVTTRTGYIRFHSRKAEKWYAGGAERYDYNYSRQELMEVIEQWRELEDATDRVFAFFNNCHRGQAAENAEAFRRLLGGADAD